MGPAVSEREGVREEETDEVGLPVSKGWRETGASGPGAGEKENGLGRFSPIQESGFLLNFQLQKLRKFK